GNSGRLRVDDFDLEIGCGCGREKNEEQKRSAQCAHNHPPFHAKGVKVDGLRRSPGFASEDEEAIGSWQLAEASGFCRRPSREYSQWTAAIFSLTVARQRGNCTRFPVFAMGQRRA